MPRGTGETRVNDSHWRSSCSELKLEQNIKPGTVEGETRTYLLVMKGNKRRRPRAHAMTNLLPYRWRGERVYTSHCTSMRCSLESTELNLYRECTTVYYSFRNVD